MRIVIAGFDERDAVELARAKNYVARNFPGEGHVVTQDTSNADVTVTPETLELEIESQEAASYDFGSSLPDFTTDEDEEDE